MTRSRSVQPRPHSALRQSPAFALRFLADRMRRSVEEVLAEQGYSWCEYTALTVVCEVVGLSQTALAERTAFDRTRISEAVARLEEHELVARDAGHTRRRRLVYPTVTGRALRAKLAGRVADAERAALLPLDPRQRARLAALVAELIPPDRGILGF